MEKSRRVQLLHTVAAVCLSTAAVVSWWAGIQEGFTTWDFFFAVLLTVLGVYYAIIAWREKRANDAGGVASDVEH